MSPISSPRARVRAHLPQLLVLALALVLAFAVAVRADAQRAPSQGAGVQHATAQDARAALLDTYAAELQDLVAATEELYAANSGHLTREELAAHLRLHTDRTVLVPPALTPRQWLKGQRPEPTFGVTVPVVGKDGLPDPEAMARYVTPPSQRGNPAARSYRRGLIERWYNHRWSIALTMGNVTCRAWLSRDAGPGRSEYVCKLYAPGGESRLPVCTVSQGNEHLYPHRAQPVYSSCWPEPTTK